MNWLKSKWSELSTQIGVILGALSGAIPMYVAVNPKLAYVGLAVSVLLVLWKEDRGNA